MRSFSFLAAIQGVMDGATLAAEARRAEGMGFAALVVPDHMIEQLSPIPALAVIAAATQRLRVSAFVHNNDLRHPAVLAQELASLDVLSGGRLDVAIGAGWNKPEYDAIGLPFDPTPVVGLVEKFQMLRERLGITSFMVGNIDDMAPVVERLAGT